MSFVLQTLATRPDVMTKLQEEVDDKFANAALHEDNYQEVKVNTNLASSLSLQFPVLFNHHPPPPPPPTYFFWLFTFFDKHRRIILSLATWFIEYTWEQLILS